VTARRSDLDPIELESFESSVTRGKLVLGCESVDESENMSPSFPDFGLVGFELNRFWGRFLFLETSNNPEMFFVK
jgi:hypothetical protein